VSRVPFQRPLPPSPEAILAHYRRSCERGWYAGGGPCGTTLAERLAEPYGADAGALPLVNGTLALFLTLAALRERRAGADLVATASFTCPAVGGAIRWAGLRPLWVDIDPYAWQVDPAALADALNVHGDRVAAAVVGGTFGTPPDDATMAAWRAAGERHRVPVVVDAAAGLGAEWDLEGAAALIHSLHATKPGGIGEGGALISPDAELLRSVGVLAAYGIGGAAPRAELVGLNAKLPELMAAAALAMLDVLAQSTEARRDAGARLGRELRGLGLVRQAGWERSAMSAHHVVAPDARTRGALLEAMAAHDVEVRTLWDPPLHAQGVFGGVEHGDLDVTADVARR
jgi:dTDP-4-amino-4,6-dideoxygalactose transaminase